MTAVVRPVADPAPMPVPVWWGLSEVPDDIGPSVVTVGVFDGVHRGHRRLIDHARRVADVRDLPLVLVTFDPHPAQVLGLAKDTSTLTTLDHRAELAAAAGADAVCVVRFTREVATLSPAAFARRLAETLDARAVVVGANFTFGAGAAGDVTTLYELGAVLGFSAYAVPLLDAVDTAVDTAVDAPCSSTYTRRFLRSGDLDAANRALGRPHQVTGVRYGDCVEPAPQAAVPAPGRYVASVNGDATLVEVTAADAVRLVDGDPWGDGPVVVAFHARQEPDR